MIATEDTPTDVQLQQTNWIKDEWLVWKGVQMERGGWGGEEAWEVEGVMNYRRAICNKHTPNTCM